MGLLLVTTQFEPSPSTGKLSVSWIAPSQYEGPYHQLAISSCSRIIPWRPLPPPLRLRWNIFILVLPQCVRDRENLGFLLSRAIAMSPSCPSARTACMSRLYRFLEEARERSTNNPLHRNVHAILTMHTSLEARHSPHWPARYKSVRVMDVFLRTLLMLRP